MLSALLVEALRWAFRLLYSLLSLGTSVGTLYWNFLGAITLPSRTLRVQNSHKATIPSHSQGIRIDTSSRLDAESTSFRLKCLQEVEDNVAINKLPPEILITIFEIAVDENRDIIHTISDVSRYWHAVSLLNPKLWNHITLPRHPDSGCVTKLLRAIRTHVNHARAVPILVDLDFRCIKSLAEARAVMQVLHPHLAKCFSLRVNVPDWDWMAVIAENCDNMHDTLESIALRIEAGHNTNAEPVPVLKGVFPHLTHVSLGHIPISCIFAKAHAPRLQVFHVVHDPEYPADRRVQIPWQEYLSALTSSIELEDICLESAEIRFDHNDYLDILQPTYRGPPIPRLTVLCLSFVSMRTLQLPLALSLPSLIRLEIEMDSGPDGFCFGGASDLSYVVSEGRLPSLRHLALRNCATHDINLLLLCYELADLPQLTTLEIAAPPSGTLSTTLFMALAAAPKPEKTGAVWFLPNLRFLSVNGCRAECGHEILRMVRARAEHPGVACLHALHIVSFSSFDPEVEEGLLVNLDEVKIVNLDVDPDDF